MNAQSTLLLTNSAGSMARKPQLAAGSHAIPEEEEQQQQPQDGSKHKPQKKKEPAGWASAVSGALSGMLIGLLVQVRCLEVTGCCQAACAE